MKIIDDFLPSKQFERIRDNLMADSFPWYWNAYQVFEGDGKPQLVHGFMQDTKIESIWFKLFQESDCIKLWDKNGVTFFRVKANLNNKTPEHIMGEWHTDFRDKKTMKDMQTAIFYINTNNGYTAFKNGDKVESVANRMVMFDCSTEHAAVTCTDEDRRVVVNFNFKLSTPVKRGFAS